MYPSSTCTYPFDSSTIFSTSRTLFNIICSRKAKNSKTFNQYDFSEAIVGILHDLASMNFPWSLVIIDVKQSVNVLPITETVGICICFTVEIVASLYLHISTFKKSVLLFICLYVSLIECSKLFGEPESSINMTVVSIVLNTIPSRSFLLIPVAR